jgi:RND family efflux transporter MFP subunit
MNASKRAWLILGASALTALALGYWVGRSSAKAAAEAPEHEAAGVVATVKVAAMRKGRLQGRLSALGSVVAQPGASQVVAVGYECKVASILVSEGQPVAAGTPLLTVVDSADARLLLDQARIDAQAAKVQFQQAESKHGLKLADNGAMAQAQQALDSAQARVKSLEGRQMGVSHVLRAAAPGVVVRVPVQAGAVVPSGGSLMELADTSKLEVRLGVEPAGAEQLKAGAPLVLAAVDGAEARDVSCRIRAISPALNPATRLCDVYASLPSGHGLRFGQFVRGSLAANAKEGFLVPYEAVLPVDGANVLFTVRDKKAVRHEVQVGVQNGGTLQVSGKDLDPAEPVVVVGNYELQDGMAVQVEGQDR